MSVAIGGLLIWTWLCGQTLLAVIVAFGLVTCRESHWADAALAVAFMLLSLHVGLVTLAYFFGVIAAIAVWKGCQKHDDDDEPRRKRRELGQRVKLRTFGGGFVPAALGGTA